MLEYAGSQRAGRREREALHLLAVVRSFDWILVAGLAALVVVGLWGIGGVTSHDVAGNPNYYLNKQILYAAAGGLGARRRRARRPRLSTAATGGSSTAGPWV